MPQRGEVWLCDLDPTRGHEQAGQRPCLVVSANELNSGGSGMIMVCPVTKVNRGIPFHIPISANESRLDFDSVIECDQIRSIAAERFSRRIGVQLNAKTMIKVEGVLKTLLCIR